ncbi:surface protein [Butyrivibrio sp. ob235]|uniref:BspA family leucine-rich repeat surface protein n=1 Tax=Butyrivibrio sp. ob235 TaxID=1761780 RepID=UPI0008D524DA|nr:BspA family leucine-rich repeat surface protein [Butyrivibrio sp. ob235]SEM10929.1 surface protein [Butyrivibrio sp. ob235]
MERNRKSLVWVIAAFLCVALFFGCSSGNFKIKAEAASSATLVTGNNFNKALKKFVSNKVSSYTDEDETIEHVIFMAKGSTPNKKLPSKNIGTANNSVMAYYDSEKKNVYIYSAANTIFLNADSANMFYGYTAVKSIEFNGRISTSRVTNFNDMFGLCHKLEVLDVSNFDTSKATNLSGMFNHCDVLKTIDISNFNTSKVTSMHSMFFWCSAVEKLDFSNFDTSKVEYFTQMFVGCYGLESLDLSSFKTSNVTEMYRTFDGCKNLKSLDLSNFDTSKVTNMKWMFEGCYNLENLNISSFNTSKVTDCTEMLNRCDKLKVLDAPKIIGKAIALPGEFGLDNNKDGKADNATVYTKLAVKKSGTSNRYINLKKEEEKKPEDGATLNTGKSINLALKRFVDSKILIHLYDDKTIEHVVFLAKGVTPDKKLPSCIISTGDNRVTAHYDSGKKTVYIYSSAKTIFFNPDSSDMFYGFNALKSIEFNGRINTSKVMDFHNMFMACKGLEVLDVSKFDTSNAVNLASMFEHCDVLKTIDVSNFNTSKVTSMFGMFAKCYTIEKLDVSKFDTSKVTNFAQMFDDCYKLKSLDLSGFNTSNATNMRSAFNYCSNLKSLDLSNFDTSKVTNMATMFLGCTGLETLNISSFNTGKVTDCAGMFNFCGRLKVIDAPKVIGMEIELPGEFGLDNNKDGKADDETVYKKLGVKKSGASDRYINLRKEEEKKPDPSESGESGNEGGSESGNQGDGSESGKPEDKPTPTESPAPIDTANQSNPYEQAAQASNPATPQVEAEAAEKIDGKQKRTSITKLTAGKKSITIAWKKQTGIKGYEIQYTTDKNFNKDVNAVTIVKAKTTSKTIKKLKTNKKYYVRIRTYKKSGAEKIYSKWSKSKSVKVK